MPEARLISASELVRRSWEATQVVAHRGASADEPENTIAAFERAILDGAPAVECDVRLSRDGVPVALHDASLDRTTPLSGLVAETDSSTMVAAGIPTLEHLIDAVKGRVVLIVEIKAGEGLERLVVDLLADAGLSDLTIVFSFDCRSLQRVKRLNPSLFTAWLLGEPLKPSILTSALDRLGELGADAVGVGFDSCSEVLMQAAHARRIPVFAWTVPPGHEVARLRSLRTNFIITNHPAEVLAQLGAAEKDHRR